MGNFPFQSPTAVWRRRWRLGENLSHSAQLVTHQTKEWWSGCKWSALASGKQRNRALINCSITPPPAMCPGTQGKWEVKVARTFVLHSSRGSRSTAASWESSSHIWVSNKCGVEYLCMFLWGNLQPDAKWCLTSPDFKHVCFIRTTFSLLAQNHDWIPSVYMNVLSFLWQ